jgi:2,4-dihydroxyhept-2-ene-1,7-dioic acid aldolase
MMRREDTLERLKAKLRADRPVFGFQHNSGSESLIEVAGMCGWDFVLIDMEHTAYDLVLVERLLRACELGGITGLVRVPDHDPHTISRVLDSGAGGVLVPHVRSADECLAAVRATRYQPDGTRGKSGMCRASRWGVEPWGPYAAWAQSGPLLVPIIEDAEAVDVLEDILATPGLEIVAIGAGDLSQSFREPHLGVRSPRVKDTLRRAIRYGREHQLSVMTLPAPDLSGELVRELIDQGVRVVWWGSDISHFTTAIRSALAQVSDWSPTGEASA